MNSSPCCHAASGSAADSAQPAPSLRRRGAAWAGWLLPSLAFVLVPKCPVCVATYVMLFTGIGLSVTAAANLRVALLILCSMILLATALWTFGRVRSDRRS